MRAAPGTSRFAIRLKRFALLAGLAASPVSGGGDAEHLTLADRLRRGPGTTNHPIGVVPSAAIRVPQDWPLDTNGSITCKTCHEELPSLEGGTATHLRRIDDPRVKTNGFCASCHAEGRLSAATAHWTVVRLAHPKVEADSPTRWEGPLDADSTQCLECHDGVNAADSGETPPGGRGGAIGDAQRSHPIGTPYLGLSPRKSSVRLRPPSLLPKAIRLPDGKVSCISCHNLYATGPGRLTVPIEGSELCFTCHDMK